MGAAKALAMDSCKLLVKARAHCDTTDFEGRTALMYAQSELSADAKERDIWRVILSTNRRGPNYARLTIPPPLKSVGMHTAIADLEADTCQSTLVLNPAYSPLEATGMPRKITDLGKIADASLVETLE